MRGYGLRKGFSVAKPSDAYLRFGCPRCMARLRARPSQAGTKQRCPQCQHQFVVPTAEQAARLARRPEEYRVFEGDYEAYYNAVVAGQTAAVGECSACHTRIYGPEDQIGQEAECPDCGTKVVLAARLESPRKTPSAIEAEAYALLDQFREPPESVPADSVNIPVHCPVCNTLLHGTPEEVGKHLLCPDCYTPVLIPPLDETAGKKPKVAHPVEDEYSLQQEPAPAPSPSEPAKPQAEAPRLIPVVCNLCQTRMHATEDRVGELVTCPDCGTPAVVPRPETLPKPSREGTAVGEYGMGAPVERLEYTPPVNLRLVRIEPGDTKALEEAQRTGIVHGRPAPPRWPFWTGVFTFLGYQGTWPWIVGLTLGLLFVLPVMLFGLALMGLPNMGAAVAVPWMAAMIFVATSTTLFLLWCIVACAPLLPVIQDTAEGADQIASWPEAVFTDWAFDFLYFVNAFVVSVLPGVVAYQFLSEADPRVGLAIPASVFFLFPVALLSMLDAGSPFVPVSGPVWGSVFSTCWAWAIFYLETGVILLAFLAFFGAVLYLLGPWGSLLIAPVAVAVMFVYCRLLGRVAWCCAREAEDEEDEGEEDDKSRPRKRPCARSSAPPRTQSLPAPPPADHNEPPRPQERPAQRPTPPESPPRRPSRSILDDDFDDG